MNYQYLLTGAAFAVCSYTDLKFRRVDLKVAVIYLILSLCGHLFGQDVALADLGVGLLPGAFCFLISWISRQSLGYGDDLLILICGISLGVWNCIWTVFTAFFWAGIWAVFMFVVKKAEREREFPFVPFLLLGFIIQWTGGFQT
jgi:leader peptidase (prepilin peptidase)/N-methyltransferase